MSDSWINPGLVIASPFLAGAGTVTVERRQQTIGNNGRVSITTSTITVQGIITPAGAATIAREEAFQVMPKMITVVTRTRLYGVALDPGGQAYQPDRVHWHGDVYQVVSVQDAAGYGPGYVVAHCNSIDYTDHAAPA